MNEFRITGQLEKTETFVTKAGKNIITIVLAIDGKWPQYVPIKLFGGLADKYGHLAPGIEITVQGKLGGREWNGKFYAENTANDVEVHHDASATVAKALPRDESDDVPF